MEYRSLGRTGLKVSEICLGTMTFGNQADEREAFAIMDAAADAGVNFIDTADVYPLGGTLETVGRTEEIVGRWLQGRRDRFVLATKCTGATGTGPNDRGSSRRHILEAVDASLRRLGTDYIDLYQMHQVDPTTPLEEIVRTLDDLVRWGKVRYVGVSNYPAWRMALMLGIADRHGWERLASDQPRYNLLFREIEHEVVPLCQQEGIGIIAYNPLAGGFLTGRYRKGQEPEEGTRFTLRRAGQLYQERYWHDAAFDAVEAMREFFTPRERPLAQVALAWVLGRPGITSAILGASRAAQLRETLPAVDVRLTEEELAFLDDLWYRLPRQKNPAVATR
ncbi:MAG TPA: aldo/keto reductase [Dehalococcoidia bacterium]